MHSQSPPIAHRDIKVENVLLNNKKFKLCDFGSASTDVLEYDGSLSQARIDEMFEDYEKYTTLMYRPPEMIDKYLRWGVSTKVDIWVSLNLSNLTHVDDRMRGIHTLLRSASFLRSPTSCNMQRLVFSTSEPQCHGEDEGSDQTVPDS